MQREKLETLLHEMTLTEKIDQLVMLDNSSFEKDAFITGPQAKLGLTEDVMNNIGAVYNVIGAEKFRKVQAEYLKNNRLHIPLLSFADIIYGLKTVMPIPLGYACSWDTDKIKECMNIVADEVSASGIHAVFSPMLDLSRDPRWGRVMEGTGEDPYLNSQIAKAEITGLQGNLDQDHVASCIKHFAAYGAAEGGRDYNSVDMSERKLRQEYLCPYKAAIDAGAKMVMPSFNTINGIPSTANQWLLKQVLEEEWGFHGVKVSDYAAIQELVYHGFAEDEDDAAARAIECGVNFDMKTGVYANHMQRMVESGRVKEKTIDDAVMQILELKNELGLFEDPYRQADGAREKEHQYTKEHRTAVRKLAEESIVLLKNDGHVLPLMKEKKVALIGPFADSRSILGMWAFNADVDSVKTLHEAVIEKTGNLKCSCAKGCDVVDNYDFLGDLKKYFAPAESDAVEDRESILKMAAESDAIIFTAGEHTFQSGEAASRTDLSLPDCQLSLLHELRMMRKPLIVLVYSGRPLLLKDAADNCDALLQVYWPGTEGSAAIADILYGDINPSGKLTMSIPRNMGQLPVYYSHMKTGRPLVGSGHVGKFVSKYLDSENDPLFPFGFGLSYSDFEITSLKLDCSVLDDQKSVIASVQVKNHSNVGGETVVQLYIHDQAGTVARPVKELIDFKRISLQPGEEKTVEFVITEKQLRYYDCNMHYVTEPGMFDIYAGLDSEHVLKEQLEYQTSY